MRKIIPVLLLSIVFFSCSSSRKNVSSTNNSGQVEMSKPNPDADGSSFEKAIVIMEKSETVGVDAEYKWLAKNYPGYKMLQQALSFYSKKPYDILTIKTSDGDEKKIYFDISNFYGKL